MNIVSSGGTGGSEIDVILDGSADTLLRGMGHGDAMFADAGSDLVYGGSGGDSVSGDSGRDIIFGGGPKYIDGDDAYMTDEYSLTVTFHSEDTSLENTVGMYTFDENGNIDNVEIIFSNASANGSGGDLVSGTSSANYDVDADINVGFFLVSDGSELNDASVLSSSNSFVFKDANGNTGTTADSELYLWSIDSQGNETQVHSSISDEIFHSVNNASGNSLNADDLEHMQLFGNSVEHSIIVGFSDTLGDDTSLDLQLIVEIGENNYDYYEDNITGADGNHDVLYGNTGADLMYGMWGNDVISGDDGDDLIYGNSGDDTLYGGNGNDILKGGKGDDTFSGDDGIDYLYGNTGDDVLNGNDGGDYLYGNAGDDSIYGGKGDDVIHAGTGDDTIDGGEDDDVIHGNTGDDSISGASGNDSLYGSDGVDTLNGGEGNDMLEGGSGADELNGGAGDDHLKGGSDRDLLIGMAGDDFLNGGSDVDMLFGGDGADRLVSGAGSDFMMGGDGADTFAYRYLEDDFSGNGDEDIIKDFQVGIDSLELNDSDFDDFADLLNSVSQVGEDLHISLTTEDTLILNSIHLDDFSTGDVAFG